MKFPLAIVVLIIVFGGLVFAQGLFDSPEAKAERAAENTAQSLGWPTSTSPRAGISGTSYTVTPYGGYEEDPEIFAFVAVMPSDSDAKNVIQTLADNGMTRGSFHGREAIIMNQGDQICNPKEGTALDMTFKMIDTFLVPVLKMIAESMGAHPQDVGEYCAESYGTIVWRCGNNVFGVQDQTGYGNEDSIANALYQASEAENLCGIGDTVVILASTSDVSGTKTISNYQTIATGVNTYFSWNAYNKVDFTFTFKDADGPTGNNDWYKVDNTLASYATQNNANTLFAEAAIKKAFKDTDLGSQVYLDRVVVVYPGTAAQEANITTFSTACSWKDNNYYVEVDGSKGKSKIYVRNIILVSEQDTVGDWSHEFGHSLYSKVAADGSNFYRINDRYNYNGNPAWQYGQIWMWGLMGSGNYWGSPKGSSPTHMSAFSKEGAGWLRYSSASLNKTYTEDAIENMDAGDAVLTLDDPRSADPKRFYILEARDSSATYGAPESGINIYFVRYDNANKHYVVNLMTAQGAPLTGTTSTGAWYPKPTLYSTSGNGSVWKSVSSKFQVILQSESNNPYKPTIKIANYTPANLVGAAAAPAGAAPVPNPQPPANAHKNTLSPNLPDIDLHAYDSAGNHVGMNYATNEYEVEIPGAITTGNLVNAEESIFVPEGTQVTFEVSAERTKRFLQENSEYSSSAGTHQVELEYFKYDSYGNGMVADGGTIYVDPKGTAKVSIKSPTDSSLSYVPQDDPGFGNNSEGCCGPALLLPLILLAVFLRRN